jgi:hypothetical protein
MKKISRIIMYCTVLCISSASTMGDMYVNYNYVMASDGTLTTSYSGAIVDTFDSGQHPGWVYDTGTTGNGSIISGSLKSRYAAPYNSSLTSEPDNTNYYTTGNTSVIVDFGGATYDYLGLFWGSADGYNLIEFINGETVVSTWTGRDAVSPYIANGDQDASSTNLYVNFYDVPGFDAVRFTSYNYAFEFDNLAVTNAPIPGAVLLGMLGMVIVGLKLRKYA